MERVPATNMLTKMPKQTLGRQVLSGEPVSDREILQIRRGLIQCELDSIIFFLNRSPKELEVLDRKKCRHNLPMDQVREH